MDIKMVPKIDLLYLTQQEHFPYDLPNRNKVINGIWQGLLVCKKNNEVLKKLY